MFLIGRRRYHRLQLLRTIIGLLLALLSISTFTYLHYQDSLSSAASQHRQLSVAALSRVCSRPARLPGQLYECMTLLAGGQAANDLSVRASIFGPSNLKSADLKSSAFHDSKLSPAGVLVAAARRVSPRPTRLPDDIYNPTANRPKSPAIRCRVLRDLTDDMPEPEVRSDHVTSSRQCADDVNVLDLIEYCYGTRPVLLSNRIVNRTEPISECFLVPNVVHYILLRDAEDAERVNMTFLHYLSMLSVEQHISPSYILIHSNTMLTGDWWRRAADDVANIYLVNVTHVPTQVYGKPLKRVEHRTDILRYHLLYELGGIYLDPDVLVFRSFDPLRRLPFTLARESIVPVMTISNGIIVCSPGATFLRLWLETYRTFDPDIWSYHSVHIPARLLELFPGLVHIEDGTLVHPHWSQLDMMFGTVLYDWTAQYSTHVWCRLGKVPESPEEIQTLNSTLGQMMRRIYHDRP